MKLVFIFAMLLQSASGCWMYDKGDTVTKIEKNLAVLGRKDVDREFFAEKINQMPRVFGWAVNQIGVEAAFKDCDANQDGTITLEEMRLTNTCLDTCFKLSVVNFAI